MTIPNMDGPAFRSLMCLTFTSDVFEQLIGQKFIVVYIAVCVAKIGAAGACCCIAVRLFGVWKADSNMMTFMEGQNSSLRYWFVLVPRKNCTCRERVTADLGRDSPSHPYIFLFKNNFSFEKCQPKTGITDYRD
jgi:hypothetical protein